MQVIKEFQYTYPGAKVIRVYGSVKDPLFKASCICRIIGFKTTSRTLKSINPKWIEVDEDEEEKKWTYLREPAVLQLVYKKQMDDKTYYTDEDAEFLEQFIFQFVRPMLRML